VGVVVAHFFDRCQNRAGEDGEETQDGDGGRESDAVVGEDDVEDDAEDRDKDHRDEQSTGEFDGFFVLGVLVVDPITGLIEQ